MKEPLEDTWHDILLKAIRGWNQDVSRLALESHLQEADVAALMAGRFDEVTLRAIVPLLQLDTEALLFIARDAYHPEIMQLPDNFKRFTTTYHDMQVHSYLVWSEETSMAVAFDTGTDLAVLLQELTTRQLQLHSLFLTHGHTDHVLKLRELLEATGATAWINQAELLPGTQALGHTHQWKLDPTITITSHLLPGHSTGGTVYVIDGCSSPLAIVGDTIFAGSVGGIKNNYAAAVALIKNMLLSLPSETILAPGHGPLTTVRHEIHHNPFFAEKKERA